MLGIFMPGGGNEEKIGGSLCPAWQTLKSSQHGGREVSAATRAQSGNR